MFMLSPQSRAKTRNDGIVELLGGQVVRNIKALDKLIGQDGFACCGRLTMADCALVPGLFLVENVLPAVGVDNPIPANANVAAYWAAIQENEHAARTLAELHRGLEERREMIRSGAFDRMMAAAAAAHAAAES
jgi:glutathione S-transferase